MIDFPKFVKHWAFYSSDFSGPLFELFVYDLEKDTPDGRSIGYRLRQAGKIIFEGDDLSCGVDEMKSDHIARDIMEMICSFNIGEDEVQDNEVQENFVAQHSAKLWEAVVKRWPA